MSKTKYHYYVLVFSETGPAYVTKILPNHYAKWDKDQKPLEMSSSYAQDVYTGLCMNFHNAVLIRSLFEINTQPYNYEYWDIKFVSRKDKEDEL